MRGESDHQRGTGVVFGRKVFADRKGETECFRLIRLQSRKKAVDRANGNKLVAVHEREQYML